MATRDEVPAIHLTAPGRNIVTTQLRRPIGIGEDFNVY